MKENLVKDILTRGTDYINEYRKQDDNFTHLLSDIEDCMNHAAGETWKELELTDSGDGQYHFAKLLSIIMMLKIGCRERDSHEVDSDILDSAMSEINGWSEREERFIRNLVFSAFALGRESGQEFARLAGLNTWQVSPETEQPTAEAIQ